MIALNNQYFGCFYENPDSQKLQKVFKVIDLCFSCFSATTGMFSPTKFSTESFEFATTEHLNEISVLMEAADSWQSEF